MGLIVADVVVSSEVFYVIVGLLLTLAIAVVLLFRQFYLSVREERDSYRGMANEAVANLEAAVNRDRKLHGELPFIVVPDVVPEHSSPTTARQHEAAVIATLRARLTAATKSLGLPARGENK